MASDKAQWSRPKLIVLARGNPEESVLVHCKTMNPNQPLPGPDYFTNQLTCAMGDMYNCSVCQARAQSGT